MLVPTSCTALGVLALLLLSASYTDLKGHRIPNILTFGGAVAGLLLQTWFFWFRRCGFRPGRHGLRFSALFTFVFVGRYGGRGCQAHGGCGCFSGISDGTACGRPKPDRRLVNRPWGGVGEDYFAWRTAPLSYNR